MKQEQSYFLICVDCGHTTNHLNIDGECFKCSKETEKDREVFYNKIKRSW